MCPTVSLCLRTTDEQKLARSLIVSILTRFLYSILLSTGDLLSGDVKHSTHSGVIDDSGQFKFDMSASLKVPQPHFKTLLETKAESCENKT